MRCQWGDHCGHCSCCARPGVCETKAEYNQSTHQWLTYPAELTETEALTAGKVGVFPAGKEGKRAALLSALTANAPAVAAEVEHVINWATRMGQPDLIDRAIRAGFIIARGQLYEARPIGERGSYITEVARVQSSQDPAEFYAVTRSPSPGNLGRWGCECRDWRNGRARYVLSEDNPEQPATGAIYIKSLGVMCKHVLAVHISLKLNIKFKAAQQ